MARMAYLAFSIGGRCWCIMTCLSLSTYLAFSIGGRCWCIMTFLSLSIDWVLRCFVWKMTAVKRLRTEVCECAKCKLPPWKLMLLGNNVFDFENYWSRSLSWGICALSEKLARLSNLLSPEILGWVEWKTDHECQSWPIIFVLQWEMGMSGICFSAYEEPGFVWRSQEGFPHKPDYLGSLRNDFVHISRGLFKSSSYICVWEVCMTSTHIVFVFFKGVGLHNGSRITEVFFTQATSLCSCMCAWEVHERESLMFYVVICVLRIVHDKHILFLLKGVELQSSLRKKLRFLTQATSMEKLRFYTLACVSEKCAWQHMFLLKGVKLHECLRKDMRFLTESQTFYKGMTSTQYSSPRGLSYMVSMGKSEILCSYMCLRNGHVKHIVFLVKGV